MPWPSSLAEFTSLAVCQSFWAAVKERATVLDATYGGTSQIGGRSAATVPLPTAGAELVYAGASGPQFATDAFSLRCVQDWLESSCTQFVNEAAGVTILHPGVISYTLATWRSAAGINASGFLRTRPREIGVKTNAGTYTNATDLSGNAATAGMTAIAVHTITSAFDFASPPANGTRAMVESTGQVLQYRASPQAWITPAPVQGEQYTMTSGVGATSGAFKLSMNGTETAPIAYNATAATIQAALQAVLGGTAVTCTALFATITITISSRLSGRNLSFVNVNLNTVSATPLAFVQPSINGYSPATYGVFQHDGTQWVQVNTMSNATAIDIVTSYGKMQQGDYITETLLNELRDGFNALTTTYSKVYYEELTAYNPNDTVGATWAAAKADAEATYAFQSEVYGVAAYNEVTFQYQDMECATVGVFQSPNYVASPQVSSGRPRVSLPGVAVASDTHFYVACFPAGAEADDYGSGLPTTFGATTLYETVPAAAGATSAICSAAPWDASVRPSPWCAEPTVGVPPQNARGLVVRPFAATEWDFEYV